MATHEHALLVPKCLQCVKGGGVTRIIVWPQLILFVYKNFMLCDTNPPPPSCRCFAANMYQNSRHSPTHTYACDFCICADRFPWQAPPHGNGSWYSHSPYNTRTALDGRPSCRFTTARSAAVGVGDCTHPHRARVRRCTPIIDTVFPLAAPCTRNTPRNVGRGCPAQRSGRARAVA